MPPNCTIYARISRDATHTGLGVQRQLADCRELAERLGWKIVGEYVDNDTSAYSGKKRPRYLAMLDRIQNGDVHGVLAWHTDRLHRSPVELERYIDICESNSITTHTVRAGEIDLSTPSGRAVARTLGAWARYESEHRSERVRRKMLELAQSGQRQGGPTPYGYRIVDGSPVISEPEAVEVRAAFAAIVAGRSIGSIVRDLNDRGIKSPRGGEWTSTAVRNMVLRATYAGLVIYQGEVLDGVRSEFPPIVSEDVYRASANIVRDPTRRSHRESAVRHLLSGLVRCGKCDRPMTISSRTYPHRRDERHYYYKCKTRGDGHSTQNAAPLEEYVSEVIIGVLGRPETLAALSESETVHADVEALRMEEGALRNRLTEAASSFAEGSITAGQLQVITSTVQGKLSAIEDDLARAAAGGSAAGFAGPGARERWEAADVEARRSVIDALVDVYVDPTSRPVPRVFDAERVRFEWKS